MYDFRVDVEANGLVDSIRDGTSVQLVDTLSDIEARELRLLVNTPEDQRQELFASRAQNADVADVYCLLNELGYIKCYAYPQNDAELLWLNYKASWALGRYDERKRRESEERKRQRNQQIFDKVWAVAILVIGFVLGKIF